MIRKLVALVAGCAAACLASAALATTVTGAVSNGALSSPLPVTATNPFSITMNGAVPIDSSGSGIVHSPYCFTVMRSQDGTNFAPLARDVAGNLARYCGPITLDLTEARSGTSYAIQADPGAPTIPYRLDQ